MNGSSHSRRTVLRTGAAALGSAAVAGCLGPLGGDDEPAESAAPIRSVPAGSRLVAHADASALFADDVLRDRLNDLLGNASLPTGSVESVLDAVESEYGLDPRELDALTAFAGYEPDSPVGVRFEAAWSESALRDAFADDGSTPEPEDYEGTTVYRFEDDTILGVVGDGTYVAGTQAGVEAAVDVAEGRRDPVESLRESFASSPAGPIRFAFDAPEDLGEGEAADTDSSIDPAAIESITHGYGGYMRDGDQRRASLTLATESTDDASLLAEGIRAFRDEMQAQLEQRGGAHGALADPYEELLNSMDVSTDGSTVAVTADRGEVMPIVIGAVVGAFTLELGSSQTDVRPPQVAFEFDYDAETNLLEVRHHGGDVVRTDELFVRGEGLTSAPEADMDGPGQWVGTTSATPDGEPAVAAGDAMTVGFEADGVCQLVWEASDDDTAATLARFDGPEA